MCHAHRENIINMWCTGCSQGKNNASSLLDNIQAFAGIAIALPLDLEWTENENNASNGRVVTKQNNEKGEFMFQFSCKS